MAGFLCPLQGMNMLAGREDDDAKKLKEVMCKLPKLFYALQSITADLQRLQLCSGRLSDRRTSRSSPSRQLPPSRAGSPVGRRQTQSSGRSSVISAISPRGPSPQARRRSPRRDSPRSPASGFSAVYRNEMSPAPGGWSERFSTGSDRYQSTTMSQSQQSGSRSGYYDTALGSQGSSGAPSFRTPYGPSPRRAGSRSPEQSFYTPRGPPPGSARASSPESFHTPCGPSPRSARTSSPESFHAPCGCPPGPSRHHTPRQQSPRASFNAQADYTMSTSPSQCTIRSNVSVRSEDHTGASMVSSPRRASPASRGGGCGSPQSSSRSGSPNRAPRSTPASRSASPQARYRNQIARRSASPVCRNPHVSSSPRATPSPNPRRVARRLFATPPADGGSPITPADFETLKSMIKSADGQQAEQLFDLFLKDHHRAVRSFIQGRNNAPCQAPCHTV